MVSLGASASSDVGRSATKTDRSRFQRQQPCLPPSFQGTPLATGPIKWRLGYASTCRPPDGARESPVPQPENPTRTDGCVHRGTKSPWAPRIKVRPLPALRQWSGLDVKENDKTSL